MCAKVSKRSVLNSLSLSDLKKVAKALHIDLTPKFTEIPLVKLRGEKYFIVDKLARFRGITIEDIDEVLNTNFSKKGKQKSRESKIPEKEEEDITGVEFFEVLLDKYFYKEDLQIMLDSINLPRSGTKDELIERIIESGEADVQDILGILNKDVLVEICEIIDLETKGTKDQLKKRILDEVEYVEEIEEEKPQKEPPYAAPLPQNEHPYTPPPPPQTQYHHSVPIAPPPPPQQDSISDQKEFDNVVNGIHQWIPTLRHTTEEGYKSDLANFLQYRMGYFVR